MNEITKTPCSPVLQISLSVAVLLWQVRIQREKWPDAYRKARATICADIVAAKGDVLQFGGKGCAEAFNALAEGLALLSFSPGGVTFWENHFDANNEKRE